MDHFVAFEHEIAVLEIDMALLGLVPRHDVVEVGDPGGFGHGFVSLVNFFPILSYSSPPLGGEVG
jgi:hypothetical protein